MDVSDSSTSADEDDDVSNLWQVRRHDLDIQDMLPLITDSNESSDDESSFTSVSQDLSENEMSNNPQIETSNVMKLKITTPMEGCQPHPRHVN